jgi:bifunctional non-homologous end joining protein LigD
MPTQLDTYQRKRNFRRTPEPRGARRRARGELTFVVQRHDATRLHYDFRLEHDGVLKSWAVPKEPSYDPKDRRLAVRTEDHPLEYATFEGEIPEPEYGAGTVVIWDRGHWSPHGDPDRGLADGKLDFELHGERLRGRWTLVRMADRGARKRAENWLLIKRTDKPAEEGAPRKARARTDRAPRRGGAKKRVSASDVEAVKGAKREALPRRLVPQLATLVREPPAGTEWLHEPKLDGYRLLCRVDGGDVELITRRGNDWTDRFPGVAKAAGDLPCRTALLDGEAVVFDSRGITDFQRLQNAIARADPAIVLVAFDLLHLDGWDLRGASLRERKTLLSALLEEQTDPLRYGEHVEERGDVFFREVCRLGLEGIVSKRAADPYREKRTRSWLKVKCVQRQEFVIVGYTDPAGSRTGFGALLLGVHESRGGALRYAGKVGTGFDELALRTLKKRLAQLETRKAVIDVSSAPRSGVHWVEPELVAEISFGEWTADGRLRHPVFHGLREDKPARDVVAEHPAEANPGAEGTTAPRAKRARQSRDKSTRPRAKGEGAATEAAIRPRAAMVKLTSPDKVLFPEPGITKRQLANYWEQIAEHALPFMERRPLTLKRCPEGYGAQCFYQKHVGIGVPEVVARVAIKADEEPYAMVDGLPALLGLVQISALELHVWGSRAEHIDQPDIIVFDLDPAEDVGWHAVVDAAFLIKERLESLGLSGFVRLTGGKGLHVVVPVVPGPEWPAVKKFARAFVNDIVREDPRRFTPTMSKSQRGGKIFLDYLRNDREATAIASYSPRARAGAPVALPIEWDELGGDAETAPRYGLLDVPALVRRRDRDPWADFEEARRSLVS